MKNDSITINRPLIWSPYNSYPVEFDPDPNLWGEYTKYIMFSIHKGQQMYLIVPGSLSKSGHMESIHIDSVEQGKELAESICREHEGRSADLNKQSRVES